MNSDYWLSLHNSDFNFKSASAIFQFHPCTECGSAEHHSLQHSFSDQVSKEEGPYAFVGDGVFCKKCGPNQKDKEAISFKELRVKAPHGYDCDNCGKMIVPERPHLDSECPKDVKFCEEPHISEDDPRAYGYWGGHEDAKETIPEVNRMNS